MTRFGVDTHNPIDITAKKKLATLSLAGCFGCHMSLLDIDLRLIDLVAKVDISKSPLTDIKKFQGPCDIGLVEGGCGNDENITALQSFRQNCRILVSVGACAINGGLPALRNHVPLSECLEEAYCNSPGTTNPSRCLPNDPDIPKLLDRIYPCHEIVTVDYFLPGCPPDAEVIWTAMIALINDSVASSPLIKPIPNTMIKYD